MLNLKELSERYKDVGLGRISFGGWSYYEINSDIPLSLNSFCGKRGFVLNEKGEVELFQLATPEEYKYYFNDKEIPYDEYWELLDSEMYDDTHFNVIIEPKKWWGKTLDNYYPHPWYPERKIIAFELVNDIPFNRKGTVEEVVGEGENSWIELPSPEGAYDFTVSDCLNCPEFFKPVYDEI